MNRVLQAGATLSPAQRQVLTALKRQGEASAEQVAATLGITPSAVRQHFGSLKSAGYVASRQERGKPGRPVDVYHSTEFGEALFGPGDSDVSLELLGYVEEEEPDLLRRLFEQRRRRRVSQASRALADKSLPEKISTLVSMLDAEGYLANLEQLEGGGVLVVLHSCAIWGVASRYDLACATELQFFQQLLPEAEIERVEHKGSGGFRCGYRIRPRSGFDREACPLWHAAKTAGT
ncbi:MAG: helix-turn-helix domain-containing protein [Actinomycetota bacterium]|nr:helix-turn-helix domain-containing protein [Actinomycetota bacterium]